MFCSQCGQAVAGQPRCPRCGAITGVAGFAPFSVSRIAQHVRTLGILWVVFSIYSMMTWFFVMPFLHHAFASHMWMPGMDAGQRFFRPGGWLFEFITLFVLGRAILTLGVGIALLTRQPWGRIFAIVLAVFTLMKPLLGTLLGIYTLWVLLGRNADREYAAIAVSGPVPQ